MDSVTYRRPIRTKLIANMKEESTSDDEPEENNLNKTNEIKLEVFEEECDNDQMSAYELIRLNNIREREKRMRELGLDNAVKELKEITPKRQSRSSSTKPSKRIKVETEILPKREPSRRIRNLAAKSSETIKSEVKQEEEEEEELIDERVLRLTPMNIENEESEALLSRLSDLKNENIKIDPDLNFSTCNVTELQNALLAFRLSDQKRLLMKRIQSLTIHPTTAKRLVIGGCVNGHLGMWDLDSGHSANFHPHRAPLNCISVSFSDPTKLFSTSHDGTVICTDLEMTEFSNIFATDFHERIRHLTWHDQLNAHTLLITHGNGSVGILDTRETKAAMKWFPCFDRSARTVQHHPLKENYFLVSSGAGQTCNVYDIRNCTTSKAEPVSEMLHNKGLTSAFFSPSGDKVLTTCYDDFVRIFTSPLETSPVLKKAIPHNNFTGRWLSVFKATWYPGRDDAFLIGSLLNPRRMQIYGIDGKLINELKDEELNTITSLIAVHPSLPLIVGGNSSGKVFAFSK